jgi:hypothetical protein
MHSYAAVLAAKNGNDWPLCNLNNHCNNAFPFFNQKCRQHETEEPITIQSNGHYQYYQRLFSASFLLCLCAASVNAHAAVVTLRGGLRR